MQLLSDYIHVLLYHHDCVIVPQFGGFVTNFKPATLHPRKHIILPPSKQVSFNKHLLNNDGLLVNEVAQDRGLAYEDAIEMVKLEVEEMKKALLSGKRIEFKNVGVVYLNENQAWQFIPNGKVNFLQSSYGFAPIALTLIEGKNEEDREEKEIPIVQLPPDQDPKVVVVPAKRKRKIWKVAAVAVPILAAAFLLNVPMWEGESTLSLVQLDAFAHQEKKSSYSPRFEEEDISFPKVEIANAVDLLERDYPEMESVYYSFEDERISPEGYLIRMKEEEAKPESFEEVISRPLQLHFVIAGAFGDPENAENLLQTLKEEGFDAVLAGTSGKLELVAFGSYTTKKAARKALQEIKAKGYAQAWVK